MGFSGPVARTVSDASCTDEVEESGTSSTTRCSSIGLSVYEDPPAASAGLTVFEYKPVQQPNDNPIKLAVQENAGSTDISMTGENEDSTDASPTVNTAAAINDVASMFSGPVARTVSDASCTDEVEESGTSSTARCSSIGLSVYEDPPAASAGLTVFEDKPVQQPNDNPIKLAVQENAGSTDISMTGENEDSTDASPTVNTAAAINDVASMFSGPVARTVSDASCTDEVEESGT